METKVCCALLDVHRVCRLWLMDFFNARFVEMEAERGAPGLDQASPAIHSLEFLEIRTTF